MERIDPPGGVISHFPLLLQQSRRLSGVQNFGKVWLGIEAIRSSINF